MFKSKNLNKFVSVGVLSIFLFAFSFAVVSAVETVIPNLDTRADVTKDTLDTTVTALINWVIGIIAIVAIVMFVYAGYLYISSSGDEKKVGQAKSLILYSVIGLVVTILAYSIVGFMNSLL